MRRIIKDMMLSLRYSVGGFLMRTGVPDCEY